jgi:hypothetical protein
MGRAAVHTWIRSVAVVSITAACVGVGLASSASASTPDDVTYLKITPRAQTVPAGLDRELTAIGYDSSGNVVGDVTSATTFSMVAADGGDSSTTHCDANQCWAHDPGGYVIIGTYANPDHRFAWGTAKMRAIAPIVMTMSTDLASSTLLYDGTMLQGHDTAVYSNGDRVDVTKAGGWMVENPSIATVTPGGRITALSPGTTQLDFGVDGFGAYVQLVVDRRKVSITSVSPGGGYVNDLITIHGTNLDSAVRARIGGVPAYLTIDSGQTAHVNIPSGATSGPIKLSTGHGYVTAPFTVYG